jgi:chemosensory pili system protein ChpA (sensor histidine kinase/response regulator)
MPASQNSHTAPPCSSAILDEVDAALLPIFVEEADELMPKMLVALQAWRLEPDNQSHSLSLKRLLHSFKGSARMVGAMRIGAFAHQVENRLAFFAQNSNQLGDWDSLEADFAQLNELVMPLRLAKIYSTESKLSEPTESLLRFGSLRSRFERVVAQTASMLGKKAQLMMSGDEITLDRATLSSLATSLDHLLRNAIVHGLENPIERQRLGKSEIGSIRLALFAENKHWVIHLSDDGSGFNLNEISKKHNINNELDSSPQLALEDAISLIFTAGFSTANEVNEIAGRGIGLSVVQNEVHDLGGEITVASQANQGVEFTLYLPKMSA